MMPATVTQRLIALYHDALDEGVYIKPTSLVQCIYYFRLYQGAPPTHLCLTPDNTIIARWNHESGNVLIIEFTGENPLKIQIICAEEVA